MGGYLYTLWQGLQPDKTGKEEEELAPSGSSAGGHRTGNITESMVGKLKIAPCHLAVKDKGKGETPRFISENFSEGKQYGSND